MKIKHRIERLAKASNIDAGSCLCKGGEKTIVIIGPSWELSTEKFQQSIADANKPEYCDQCRKPIQKQLIIIEGVESEIPMPA